MSRYIIKRLLSMIPVILCISIIIFFLMSLNPDATVRMILGNDATEESMALLKEELGLDKPLVVQYINYMKNLFQGDMGRSYMTNEPVTELIGRRLPVTLKLTLYAMIIQYAIGLTLGIIAAIRQNTPLDNALTVSSLVANAFPSFWIGMLMIIFFSFRLGWLPSFGIDTWQGYVLPAVTVGLRFAGGTTRFTRSNMLEVIHQDYMRTARGKGVAYRVAILRHALRNALLPIVTVMGTGLGYAIGGLVIIEAVFQIPGMGTMMINAVLSKDAPIVIGAAILFATTFSIINLTVDLMYGFIDPRIKAEYKA